MTARSDYPNVAHFGVIGPSGFVTGYGAECNRALDEIDRLRAAPELPLNTDWMTWTIEDAMRHAAYIEQLAANRHPAGLSHSERALLILARALTTPAATEERNTTDAERAVIDAAKAWRASSPGRSPNTSLLAELAIAVDALTEGSLS